MAEAPAAAGDVDIRQLLESQTNSLRLRKHCIKHGVPDELRAEVWAYLLGVEKRGDTLGAWDGPYDLRDQAAVDADVLKTRASHADLQGAASKAELRRLLTFYCKTRGVAYISGLNEVLAPITALQTRPAVKYQCFYAVIARYLPFILSEDARVLKACFSLFRLLLLYHDPELCYFLDQRRITPDSFATPWLLTLFAVNAGMHEVQQLWDVLLLRQDPIFPVFVALAFLLDHRGSIMAAEAADVISVTSSLALLSVEHVSKVCKAARGLDKQTPRTFRQRYHQVAIAQQSGKPDDAAALTAVFDDIDSAVCLSVATPDLVMQCFASSQKTAAAAAPAAAPLRYFVVDCRTIAQFQQGRLPTAFHMQPSLLLDDPAGFDDEIAHFEQMRGDHLCFVGSGRAEDQQVFQMLVLQFLTRGFPHVSAVAGGFSACHAVAQKERLDLVDHDASVCDLCLEAKRAASVFADTETALARFGKKSSAGFALFGKQVKAKLGETSAALKQSIDSLGAGESRTVSLSKATGYSFSGAEDSDDKQSGGSGNGSSSGGSGSGSSSAAAGSEKAAAGPSQGAAEDTGAEAKAMPKKGSAALPSLSGLGSFFASVTAAAKPAATSPTKTTAAGAATAAVPAKPALPWAEAERSGESILLDGLMSSDANYVFACRTHRLGHDAEPRSVVITPAAFVCVEHDFDRGGAFVWRRANIPLRRIRKITFKKKQRDIVTFTFQTPTGDVAASYQMEQSQECTQAVRNAIEALSAAASPVPARSSLPSAHVEASATSAAPDSASSELTKPAATPGSASVPAPVPSQPTQQAVSSAGDTVFSLADDDDTDLPDVPLPAAADVTDDVTDGAAADVCMPDDTTTTDADAADVSKAFDADVADVPKAIDADADDTTATGADDGTTAPDAEVVVTTATDPEQDDLAKAADDSAAADAAPDATSTFTPASESAAEPTPVSALATATTDTLIDVADDANTPAEKPLQQTPSKINLDTFSLDDLDLDDFDVDPAPSSGGGQAPKKDLAATMAELDDLDLDDL